MASHGSCTQGIVDVIAPNELGRHLMPLSPTPSPTEPQVRVTSDELALRISVVSLAVGHRLQTVGNTFQVFVVTVKEDGSPGRSAQVVIHLALGVDNSLERAESLQMGQSHVGNESIIRFGNIYQFLDVARVIGPHLHDGHLVFTREAK